MTRLFGTDGIRARAGEFPLTPDFVTRLGGALAQTLVDSSRPARVLIGRDTRSSGEWIERALTRGLNASGFETLSVGVLPTPGIAYLTRTASARAGIAISASHNPFEDNGIKIFGANGFKIADEIETQIEVLARRDGNLNFASATAHPDASATRVYEDFLSAAAPTPILRGKRLVVDCANGAAHALAPRCLRALGAEVIALNVAPDGVNINHGYDALEPKLLRETVLRERADWGVQFDGDADRAVFVDEKGNYLDGDFILAILARDGVERGVLTNPTVVSTVMANLGLELALSSMNLKMERVAVGDRWVTERMRELGATLGGEQSGHIVLFDGGHTTGDGIYTTVRIAEIAARKNVRLSELASVMRKHPQVLVNVMVPRKPPLEELPQVQSQVARSRAALGDGARIVLRYSGTENLARVMIEGEDAGMIAREANAIALAIKETIF